MEGAMPTRAMWMLLLCAVCSVQASEGEEETVIVRRAVAITYDPNCDPKWTAISPQHTMCMVDIGVEVVLDQATKNALVAQHNQLRTGVNPLAANMAKVIWDADLAMVAGKWARQCVVGHDSARGVPSLPGIHVGQNGAFGQGTFAASVSSWYNEVKDFTYGVGSINGGVVGHYTQVVTALTQRIGCGQAYCAGYPYQGRYYFCNYAYGQTSLSTPYRNSTTSCADCLTKCDATGKLCDCGGKMCLNGGTLNINTCLCSCQGPLYSGDTCQTLNCPTNYKDGSVCGPGNQWPPDYCQKYSNVPYSCPYMCGICKHNCGTKQCYNAGTMDYSTCTCTCAKDFEGAECTALVCGGKKCLNGGTLDKATCTCKCTSLYIGDTCQTLNCPVKDSWVCGPGNQWPPEFCLKYSNVPLSCPYMCGKCPHNCGTKQCYNAGTMDYKTCICTCSSKYKGAECKTPV